MKLKALAIITTLILLTGCGGKDNINAREDVEKNNGVLVINTHITTKPGWPVSLFYEGKEDSWYDKSFGDNQIPIYNVFTNVEPMVVRSLPAGKYKLTGLTFGNSTFGMGAYGPFNHFVIEPNTVTYVGDFTVTANPGLLVNNMKISMVDETNKAKQYIKANYPKLANKRFVTKIMKVSFPR